MDKMCKEKTSAAEKVMRAYFFELSVSPLLSRKVQRCRSCLHPQQPELVRCLSRQHRKLTLRDDRVATTLRSNDYIGCGFLANQRLRQSGKLRQIFEPYCIFSLNIRVSFRFSFSQFKAQKCRTQLTTISPFPRKQFRMTSRLQLLTMALLDVLRA